MGKKRKKTIKSSRIVDHFEGLEDPRVDRTQRHKLIDIIIIAICAVICGADSWVGMAEVGEAKHDWFKKFLELPNGIPSHDTFGRVLAALNPAQFKNCFLSWIKSIRTITNGEVIPIDGKTLRRSFDTKTGKSAIHMVSAWAGKNSMVLGQVKVDQKSNEITAIPELLDLIAIAGCIVTIDAMGCQKAIAKKIVDSGADYVLAVKRNNSKLYESLELFFQQATPGSSNNIDYHETFDDAHGRKDTRKYWTTSDIEWLEGKDLWKGLQSIGMTITESTTKEKTTSEVRLYISSLSANAKTFGNAVRAHWGIETSLHWVLDVAFREDESRIRKDNAPENLAISRHIALTLLKQEKSFKRGIAGKNLQAAMNTEYLEKVVFG
jgi:predicted transposase YbfD/YdcC